LMLPVDPGKLLLCGAQNLDGVAHASWSCCISRTACSKSMASEPSDLAAS
jgi:hypothetical protein